MDWTQHVVLQLIQRTSSVLPADVEEAIKARVSSEQPGSPADIALKAIANNIELARANTRPLCQDTGMLHFYVLLPHHANQHIFEEGVQTAVAQATALGYLRQNAIDPLTGKNSGNNLGAGSPAIHVRRHDKPHTDIRLMLKGGGCENVSAQYSLPDERLNAHRDLEGVRRCLLDAVYQAQGKGCAPGVLGVCIGGDRTTGYAFSKEQLLRRLGERNPNPVLAKLEEDIVTQSNELGIGPMGFGGKTTLIGCLIGALHRLPGSYFVSVTYMCWAFRRQGVRVDEREKIETWLY